MELLDSVSPVGALNTAPSVLASDGESKLIAEHIRVRTNVCVWLYTLQGKREAVHLSVKTGALVSLCVSVEMRWAH